MCTTFIFCMESNIQWKKNVFVQSAFYGVKLPLLQAMWAGRGWILPLVNWGIFSYILDNNWAEFEQFPIKWSKIVLKNVLRNFLKYNTALYKKNSKLETWPFTSIWLEIVQTWLNYWLILQVEGSTPALPTPPVLRAVLLHKMQIEQSHVSSTVYVDWLQYKSYLDYLQK